MGADSGGFHDNELALGEVIRTSPLYGAQHDTPRADRRGCRENPPLAKDSRSRRRRDQPELVGAPGGVGARPAVELGAAVDDVGLDGARAEEQGVRNLLVGLAERHEADDLELAPGQSRML